jgi:hypothetical protein
LILSSLDLGRKTSAQHCFYLNSIEAPAPNSSFDLVSMSLVSGAPKTTLTLPHDPGSAHQIAPSPDGFSLAKSLE